MTTLLQTAALAGGSYLVWIYIFRPYTWWWLELEKAFGVVLP